MFTLPQPARSLSRRPQRSRRVLRSLFLAFAPAALALQPASIAAQRVPVSARQQVAQGAGMADAGALPFSQPITLTLRFAPSAAQVAALDQLLADQQDLASPNYQKWLTTEAFAASFGMSDAQLTQLTGWLSGHGLTVIAVSPARTSISVSGTVGEAQTAFATSLHRIAAGGTLHFANVSQPSLPTEIAGLIASVSGLDDLPSTAAARIVIVSPSAAALPIPTAHILSSADAAANFARSAPAQTPPDPLAELADRVDANASPVISLNSTACTSDLTATEASDYRALLRQASAQGITVIASSACSGSTEAPAFPSALGEVTAVAIAPTDTTAPANVGLEDRPAWQAAPGLPADTLRHEPDLTTTSTAAFAQMVTTLNQEVGHRVGNLNAKIYALAKSPGLFTQPDAATAASNTTGSWEASTGLGTIDLAKFLKAYPRATVNSTTVGVQSSTYALNYGDSFTLTAKVLPNSYANQAPSGTITFSASSQGTIGTVAIDGNGQATLTPDVLPVGVYSITATYSGDGSYTGSVSNKTTITISIVNARLFASIAPAVNVPYGATATVTATVNLPGANAAPTGPVSAQIQGVTGAVFSATLSPNPGGSSATANIVVSVPKPDTKLYTVEVTCLGTTNFQCQTPADLKLQAVKGYTNTTVAVTPSSPQAGQPITLTAIVANAGNGIDAYVFNGSVSFYDSGKLLATAPVATNQATISLTLSGNRTHTIIATYTGDSNWNTSTSGAVAVTPTILPDALTLATNVAGSSSLAGVNIIFTATATTTITFGRGPTGTITFFDTFNGAVVQLGNPSTLVPNGLLASIGVFTTTGLLPGTHHIYAQYSGDDNYAASTSAVLSLPLSDFSVTMTPATLSLTQGKSQQVTVFVGDSGGFAGTVSLSCTPPSASLATCGFAPGTVTGAGATTLTVSTTASTISSRHGNGLQSRLLPAASTASLAAVLLLLLPRRRRALPSLLAIVFAAFTISASVGCGLGVSTASTSGSAGDNGSSGSSGSSGASGTPFGTQNFTITAAGFDGSNTVRHTYQYQVTVQ